MFVDINGHAVIRVACTVPDDPAWPSELHGMKLGKDAQKLRKQFLDCALSSEDVEELDGIGFAFCGKEWRWKNQIMPAIRTFKEVEGHLKVPYKFVVPSNDAWPERAWELPIGIRINAIRGSGAFLRGYPERKQWLEEQGFVWDVHEKQWKEVVLALEKYKEVEGHLEVPYKFEVPLSDDWPEEVRGMALGEKVNSIRSVGIFIKDKPKREQLLTDMGFVWQVNASHAERLRAANAHYGREQ